MLENVLDAETAGAACANHLGVERIARDRRGRVRGAAVVDGETGARFEIQARLVVSATGPFTDGFLAGVRRLRPTLGVHLVFDAARVPHGGRALVLRTPQDNRLYFVLPAGARTIVGTTDTDFAPAESPGRAPRIGDEIRARGADVAYLLEAARHAFPSLGLGPDDVVSTYAGLRPLLAGNAHTPSETSREHDISRTADGIVVVAGGKLTTLRRMAEETVDVAIEILRAAGLEQPFAPCQTRTRPLPGGGPERPARGFETGRRRDASPPRLREPGASRARPRRRVTRARRTNRPRPPLPLGRESSTPSGTNAPGP